MLYVAVYIIIKAKCKDIIDTNISLYKTIISTSDQLVIPCINLVQIYIWTSFSLFNFYCYVYCLVSNFNY